MLSMEDVEPDPGYPRSTRNWETWNSKKKRRRKCEFHFPQSMNPSHSYMALGLKMLKWGVCQNGPGLHSKWFLHVEVGPPEYWAMVWTDFATKRMRACCWKQLLCHLSLHFLQMKVWVFIHLSPDCIFTPISLLLTLYHRMKFQGDGGVSPDDL